MAASCAWAQQAPTADLPDAPSMVLSATVNPEMPTDPSSSSDSPAPANLLVFAPSQDDAQPRAATPPADGEEAPLELRQPHRILGIMPNFRSVSGGVKPHPLGWGYNFNVATHQAFDYSSFVFLGLNSISAEGLNEHPKLGKGAHGMWEYTWRGFIDKTDGTYLGAWLLPSLLHEDTRFFALGHGHNVFVRSMYVISRQGVARTYSGRQTPNIAGLGAKVLTQIISRQYYPAGTSDFAVLATKFGYSAMRDVIFSSIREFYPDIAAHYIRKHRAKVLQQQTAAAANPAAS